jgi:putative Mg2+ transporter-C (MgtC) family protein
MHFLHTFNLTSYLDSLLSYGLALMLGALIGAACYFS